MVHKASSSHEKIIGAASIPKAQFVLKHTVGPILHHNKLDNDIPTKFFDKVLTQLTWQQFF